MSFLTDMQDVTVNEIFRSRVVDNLSEYAIRFDNLDCMLDNKILIEKFKEVAFSMNGHQSFTMQALYSAYESVVGMARVRLPSLVAVLF